MWEWGVGVEVGVEGVLCLFVSISSCLSSSVSKFCECGFLFDFF